MSIYINSDIIITWNKDCNRGGDLHMNKFKKTAVIIGSSLVLMVQSVVPVWGADSAHYEMKGWKAGVVGDSAGISFGYIGQDGAPLTTSFPMPKSMFAGHETDPSWTGYDSTAPILAYIRKYGIDNNITEVMNASYYDPTILKSLSAQGVSMQSLGGPANPQVGKANYSDGINKVLVGVGIPAPNSSSQSTSSTSNNQSSSTSSSSSSNSSSSSPKPPAPVPPPKTTQSTQSSQTTEAKVGTNLNPVPQATETPAQSKADPSRENPPVMALQDTTPTKLETKTEQQSKKNSSLPIIIGSVTGVLILAAGVFAFWKHRQKGFY